MQYMLIYETTNNINGKKYIGQHSTLDIDDGYIGSGVLLTKAINKYGKNNFSRKILQYANNKDELNELEKYYIDKFNAIESDMYYNIAEGGYGNPMAGLTDEQKEEYRKKMSEAHKGKQLSEETKSKLRKANLGKHHTEETKAKLSEALKGKYTGRQLSDEHKAKLSEAHKGMEFSDEHKAKIRKAKKGKPSGMKGKQHSEETKARISEAKKGKKLSEEMKEKLRKANSKPVLMMNLDNKILACFDCVGDANEYCSKPRHNSSINNCLRGDSKTAYKYKWAYVNIITL